MKKKFSQSKEIDGTYYLSSGIFALKIKSLRIFLGYPWLRRAHLGLFLTNDKTMASRWRC